MSKVFKGIGKVVKNIGRGIKKVFKKVIKSKLFKIALVAVAVYFGGAALGLWGSGGAAAGAGAAAVPGASTASAGLATTAASTAAPTVAATTGVGAGLATGAEVSAALTAAPSVIAPTVTAGGAGLATAGEVAGALTATEAAAAPSFLAQLGTGAKAVGSFMQANPLLTAVGMQGISSALSPDEEDLLRAQEDMRKREFESGLEARRQNLTGFNTLPLLHQTRGNVTSLRDRRLGGT